MQIPITKKEAKLDFCIVKKCIFRNFQKGNLGLAIIKSINKSLMKMLYIYPTE